MTAVDAGTIRLDGRDVPRLGFGAMRLPGPGIWGPPEDRDRAVRVVQRALELGVRVIDTAWYYGPDVAHEIVATALRGFPSDDVVLVTKLGGARSEDRSWHAALRPEQLREGCERDLRLLRVEAVPVTHLRWMDNDEVTFAEALDVMLGLQAEGKIEHIGLSNVTQEQYAAAAGRTSIASVSNLYSVTVRRDEDMVERCAADGVPYLPFFPLQTGKVSGDDGALAEVAARRGVSPVRVAIAWLLQRSASMLPIPGTSNPDHVDDNVAAASLHLTEADLAALGS